MKIRQCFHENTQKKARNLINNFRPIQMDKIISKIISQYSTTVKIHFIYETIFAKISILDVRQDSKHVS